MSVVVLALLIALNLLTVYFSWHSRLLDARINECELRCRRLAGQNQALGRELALAAGLHEPSSSQPAEPEE